MLGEVQGLVGFEEAFGSGEGVLLFGLGLVQRVPRNVKISHQ